VSICSYAALHPYDFKPAAVRIRPGSCRASVAVTIPRGFVFVRIANWPAAFAVYWSYVHRTEVLCLAVSLPVTGTAISRFILSARDPY